MSVTFTPPPPAAVTGGGSFIAQLQPPPDADDTPSPYFSSASASSSPSSVITVMIIITSSVIVSASIYLLIRILSKRSSSAVDDVVLQSEAQKCHVAFNGTLLESLPLFSFRSITGNLSGGGDCAVCLSKFEPHDELRLLPLCCHAFHAECIDTWIVSNQTCPLCRSTVLPSGADALNKILSADNHRTSNTNIDSSRNENASGNENGGSFRIEIGSISRRLGGEIEAVEGARRHSYSVGSFEYVVDDNAYEVSVGCITHHHRRGISNCTSNVKESSVGVPTPEPPGEVLAAEVAGGRNWLKDYVDRLSSAVSISSRATSSRSSGRFFSGSSRRSEAVVVPEDLEANRAGEEISELFRWLSGI